MKYIIPALVLLLFISCKNVKEDSTIPTDIASMLQSTEWIDLTFDFDENSIYWPTNVPFSHDTVSYGVTNKNYFYSSFKFAAEEHGGTHFDAPIHFSANKNTIEKVPLSELHGLGVIVDVSKKALQNPDYLISIADFQEWESRNGLIPDRAVVLVHTGHGKYYNDRVKYLGTNLTGAEAVPHLHFPGLDPEAAKWLSEERNIVGFGLDTPSIDYGQSSEFLVHRILFEKGLTGYENVANLDKLPEKGAYIIALPMKIKGGSGAPLRIVAILPNK